MDSLIESLIAESPEHSRPFVRKAFYRYLESKGEDVVSDEKIKIESLEAKLKQANSNLQLLQVAFDKQRSAPPPDKPKFDKSIVAAMIVNLGNYQERDLFAYSVKANVMDESLFSEPVSKEDIEFVSSLSYSQMAIIFAAGFCWDAFFVRANRFLSRQIKSGAIAELGEKKLAHLKHSKRIKLR